MDLNFDQPAPYTLSANEVRQFTECPRKRYYASRDCLAIRVNKPSKNLELGKAVHMYLGYMYVELNKLVQERLVNNGIAPEYEEVEKLFNDVPEFTLPEVDERGFPVSLGDEKVFACITRNYREQLIQDCVDYEIIGPEVAFQMNHWPNENTLTHGNIDLVVKERVSGLIHFFEHKTCASFRPEIYDRFDIQLHIYAAYGRKTYGDAFGGMILNQIKNAKTDVGYDAERRFYNYNNTEEKDFFNWISGKASAITSPSNNHAPCNNYMSCKMCEYAPLCMKFGYEIPKDAEAILSMQLKNDDGEAMYVEDPRLSNEEESD